ncbi:MAG TPA: DUF1565 domain-containing protein, partial [Thermoanaerobaculia bacterium]|nr:DUF1565 domain-containing protein [Thermoanaerobaculia bacterium]
MVSSLLAPPSRWGAPRRFVGLWLAVMMTFGGPSAFAVQWFVNPTTGSDSNSGASGSPFKTIAHALSVAATGDTINAAAGVYSAASTETFPLQFKDGVAILGAGAAQSTIDGGGNSSPIFVTSGTDLGTATRLSGFTLMNGVNIAGTNFDGDLIAFDVGANVMKPEIDNNAFVGFLQSNEGLTVAWDGNPGTFDANIHNNTFDSFSRAMDFASTTNSLNGLTSLSPTISGNTFSNNLTAIYMSGSEMHITGSRTATYDPTISGNTFTGGTEGIIVSLSILTQSGTSNFDFSPTISNNTFSGLTGNAISLSMSASSISGTATQHIAPQVTGPSQSITGGSEGILMRFRPRASTAAQVTVAPSITGNTISNTTQDGIALSDFADASSSARVTVQPTITGNTVSSAGDFGIVLGSSLDGSGTSVVTYSP